jgi:hypothetical protein
MPTYVPANEKGHPSYGLGGYSSTSSDEKKQLQYPVLPNGRYPEHELRREPTPRCSEYNDYEQDSRPDHWREPSRYGKRDDYRSGPPPSESRGNDPNIRSNESHERPLRGYPSPVSDKTNYSRYGGRGHPSQPSDEKKQLQYPVLPNGRYPEHELRRESIPRRSEYDEYDEYEQNSRSENWRESSRYGKRDDYRSGPPPSESRGNDPNIRSNEPQERPLRGYPPLASDKTNYSRYGGRGHPSQPSDEKKQLQYPAQPIGPYPPPFGHPPYNAEVCAPTPSDEKKKSQYPVQSIGGYPTSDSSLKGCYPPASDKTGYSRYGGGGYASTPSVGNGYYLPPVQAYTSQYASIPNAKYSFPQDPPVIDSLKENTEKLKTGTLKDVLNIRVWEQLPPTLQNAFYDSDLGRLTPYGLGVDSAIALGKMLASNNFIKEIYLDGGYSTGNHIGDKGAIALGKALASNKTLRVLRLDKNDIGDEGAVALSNALYSNKSLTYISLNENNITYVGAGALNKALDANKAFDSNDSIAEVHLCGNKIGLIVGTIWKSQMKKNPRLFMNF